MSTTRIVGFVQRAHDKHETARFYKALGLTTWHHQHGGPQHYEVSPVFGDVVLEIYQATPTFAKDAVMLEVPSISNALQIVETFGIFPRTDLKETTEMKFIYITDPDGRDVMLIEKKPYIDASIPVNLKELREQAGFTQISLAEKLGIKQSTLSKLERRRNIRLSKLREILSALGGELDISVRMGEKALTLPDNSLGAA